MTKLRTQLAAYTDHFLSLATNPGALFKAGLGLRTMLTEITNNVMATENTAKEIETDSGLAISAQFALKCIEDIYRTRAFTAGLYQAITDKLEKNPEKTIQVLYAGCGPFATLMLPIIAKLTSDQVCFTLIEINPSSVKILNSVLKTLGLNAYVNSIEHCDALEFSIDSPDQYDIVLCEAMQAGLKNEPQVAICHKLMAQVDKTAQLIPQEIALHLYLINDLQRSNFKLGKQLDEPYYVDMGQVFVLNANTIAQNSKLFKEQYPDVEFPEVTIALPKGAQRKYDAIMLGTEITVYKEHRLSIDESGITVLHNGINFKDSMLRFKTLQAQYISDRQPGLDISIVN